MTVVSVTVAPVPALPSLTALSAIQLYNFRSYKNIALTHLPEKFVVLTGPNGAGKTNLLEAVSLLSPGKGLRGADLRDLQNYALPDDPWAVSAQIKTIYGELPIGTGKDPAKDRRIVRIKGEAAKGQAALSEYLSCLWLTPQMDRLFLDAASARRRFLDRMIFAFDPAHAGRITRYDNAMSQRSKLLKEGKADPAWLGGLETQMVETGMAVAAARVDFIHRLQQSCHRRGGADFPVAALALRGFLEDRLEAQPALQAEEAFRFSLLTSRSQDAANGGAAAGPHRTDLIVQYHAKNMPAGQCSTGEQKALLIGLVLSHAELLKAERGASALLLLDEVAAHLDEDRRAALFDTLGRTGGQVWITGTDENLFTAIPDRAGFYHVASGKIEQA